MNGVTPPPPTGVLTESYLKCCYVLTINYQHLIKFVFLNTYSGYQLYKDNEKMDKPKRVLISL